MAPSGNAPRLPRPRSRPIQHPLLPALLVLLPAMLLLASCGKDTASTETENQLGVMQYLARNMDQLPPLAPSAPSAAPLASSANDPQSLSQRLATPSSGRTLHFAIGQTMSLCMTNPPDSLLGQQDTVIATAPAQGVNYTITSWSINDSGRVVGACEPYLDFTVPHTLHSLIQADFFTGLLVTAYTISDPEPGDSIIYTYFDSYDYPDGLYLYSDTLELRHGPGDGSVTLIADTMHFEFQHRLYDVTMRQTPPGWAPVDTSYHWHRVEPAASDSVAGWLREDPVWNIQAYDSLGLVVE